VSQAVASGIGHQPPVGSLFAAFLGYNPLGTALGALPASATEGADLSTLTSKEFFPQLISGPFHHGLVIVLTLAILMSLVGAAASLLRGPRYIHAERGRGTMQFSVAGRDSGVSRLDGEGDVDHRAVADGADDVDRAAESLDPVAQPDQA